MKILEIPQRDVHRGDGAEGQPLAPEAAHAPEHVVPELLVGERVLADQQLLQRLLDQLADAGLTDAQALEPLVGADVDEDGAAPRHPVADGGVLDSGHVRNMEMRGRDVEDPHGSLASRPGDDTSGWRRAASAPTVNEGPECQDRPLGGVEAGPER